MTLQPPGAQCQPFGKSHRGLGCYGMMAGMLGEKSVSEKYTQMAKAMA